MKKHMNATSTCNAWPMSHSFTHSWCCLYCRHWRGGHGRCGSNYPGLETL